MIRALAVGLAFFTAPVRGEETVMKFTPKWEYVADTVMGGVSQGEAAPVRIEGRDATRLTGSVSLENNGGFVQIAFDVADGGNLDATGWTGIALEVFGNNEVYDLRVRTDQLSRPWQSFRASFVAPAHWTRVEIPFSDLTPHRTDVYFDPARVRRIGILAIGREMQAEISVAGIELYRGAGAPPSKLLP